MWHFLFAGAPKGRQAERCTALLAEGLTRQGIAHVRHHERVTAAMGSDGEPDQYVYIILDEGLLDAPVLRALLDSNSRLLVNSVRPPEYVLSLMPRDIAALVTVNAERVASEGGSDAEIALLGGLVHAAPGIDCDALSAAIWSQADRGFGYTARAWARAFDRGMVLARRAAHNR